MDLESIASLHFIAERISVASRKRSLNKLWIDQNEYENMYAVLFAIEGPEFDNLYIQEPLQYRELA